jgi:hypothetical protein
VTNEIQNLRATVAVTNERQTVRTNVVGVDEIQTITTTTDVVTNEVQTVTTTAVDTDEIQTVALAATVVDEVQVVRTTTANVDEIQRVTAKVSRISEVQKIGYCLTNIPTDTFTTFSDVLSTLTYSSDSFASNVESYEFQLKFDFEECGNAEGVNFCQLGVDSDMASIGTVTCSSANRNCKTDTIPFVTGCEVSGGAPTSCNITSAETIETKLNALYTANSDVFMLDAVGKGVTVELSQYMDSTADGYYCAEYTVTFGGGHLRGNVPSLEIPSSNLNTLFLTDGTGSYADSGSTAAFDVTDNYFASDKEIGNLCDPSTSASSYCIMLSSTTDSDGKGTA